MYPKFNLGSEMKWSQKWIKISFKKFHVHNMMQVNAFQTDTVRNQSSCMGPVSGRQIDRWT